MDQDKKPGDSSSGKFGKILAVGTVVALIWGLMLVILGIYLMMKFAIILKIFVENVGSVVGHGDVVNNQGQDLVPYMDTIDETVNLGKWTDTFTYSFLVLGVLTIIFACLGIYGGLYHSKIALYATIVLLIIATLVVLVLLSVALNNDSNFHDAGREELVGKLQNVYSINNPDDTFTLTMNTVMLFFQCCGVKGPGDFKNLTFVEKVDSTTTSQRSFVIAPVCCEKSIFHKEGDSTPAKMFSKVLDCAEKGASLSVIVNSKGCYQAVFDAVTQIATGILVFLLVWNILVFLLAILTIMENPPEEEAGVTKAEMRQKEELKESAQTKKFVPYAKISSFQSPDLGRIKSTEIW